MPDELEMQDAESAAEAAETLAQAAPPAVEPLQPENLNTVAEMVKTTMSKLAPPGHMADIEIAEVTEPQQSVPADLFAPVAALDAFLQSVGMEPFGVDQMVTSNDGLDQLATAVAEMGDDEQVIKAAMSPAPPEPTEQATAPEPMESKEDLDRFV